VQRATDNSPRGPRQDLADRLREAMARREMRQADLAKVSGVSKAAVSTALGGRSTPSLAVLEMLAGALGFEGQALHDLLQLRDRAESRVRRLDLYLAAAQRAAREHPYPGVFPGVVPPLSAVYLRQHATRLNGERSARTSRPAEEVLAESQTSVLVAGPGGGKSSLLRSLVATVTAEWIAGRGASGIPVVVPAAALGEGPLGPALAAAVSADLAPYGLIENLPAEFFASAPSPGATWRILIDGLDEVADPDTRSRMLRTIAAVSHGEQAALYRFVIATRPLPDSELRLLGSDVPCYELRPFDAEQVPEIVGSWLREFGLPDPEEIARNFTMALRRTRLIDLARIPLMAAMLSQVHATDPTQPLASNRGQIFEDFIALLWERQPALDLTVPGSASLARYGRSAVTRAEECVTRLGAILERLAAERRLGDTTPAIMLVEMYPAAQRPTGVPVRRWRAFLHAALRGTGLLTDQAGDLVFLHQTLLEYFAARYALREPESARVALREAFHQLRQRDNVRRIASRLGASAPLRIHERSPKNDPSFVGFLVDLAQTSHRADTTRHLRHLASRSAGPDGWRFIAELSKLGTAAPPEVLTAAAGNLYRRATNLHIEGHERFRSAVTLIELDLARATEALLGIVGDSRCESVYRVNSAMVLARAASHAQAVELLHALANNPDLESAGREDAAMALAELGERPVDLMASMSADPMVSGVDRVSLANGVLRLEPARAADVCHAMATDPTLDTDHRVQMALWLARLDESRAIEPLHALVADSSTRPLAAGQAAAELVRLGDKRLIDRIYALAATSGRPRASDVNRLELCYALRTWQDPRAADAFFAVASDVSVNPRYRGMACWALEDFGDPRLAQIDIS
jgi:transcriptional regulator with XRE-family HTH domain